MNYLLNKKIVNIYVVDGYVYFDHNVGISSFFIAFIAKHTNKPVNILKSDEKKIDILQNYKIIKYEISQQGFYYILKDINYFVIKNIYNELLS